MCQVGPQILFKSHRPHTLEASGIARATQGAPYEHLAQPAAL